MRRWVALALVISALSAACSARQEAPGLTKVKLSAVPLMTYAPIFVARDRGYFADQGLDVELVEFKRSSEALPALARGQLDAAAVSVSAAVFNAIGRTEAIKIVAGKGQLGDGSSGCSESAFLARPADITAGKYRTAADLKGRKVSGNAIGLDGWRFDVTMREVGSSIDDLELVDIEEELLLKALNSGAIDVAQASEPWLTRIADSGPKIWLTLEEAVPNAQQGLLLFGPSLLLEDPDTAERFMIAYMKGLREFNEGKTASNVRIIQRATKLERRLVTKVCWPRFDPEGGINWENIDEIQRWFHERELVDRVLDESEAWEPRFVNRANEEVGG